MSKEYITTKIKMASCYNTLKMLRRLHPHSVTNVANVCGVSPQYYMRYEKGLSSIPYDVIEKLAQFFEVNINDFVHGSVDFNVIVRKLIENSIDEEEHEESEE